MDITPAIQRIQQEEAGFRAPVSESLETRMGASINMLLDSLLPLGTIVHSMLTESQYQAAVGNSNWIIADGRNSAGSAYKALTGNDVPDLRGRFLRGKDHGAGVNPAGDLALGAAQADAFANHGHVTQPVARLFNLGSASAQVQGFNPDFGAGWEKSDESSTFGTGGDETRPRNITVNIFIKWN